MKKIFSLLLLSISMAVAIYAQKTKVPAAVTDAFNAKFPGATELKWDKENSKELEANFKFNNSIVSANFGLDGSWKETETTINASELPPAVTNAVNTKYPGSTVFLTERIEKPGNKTFYEVNIKFKGKKKELELDPEGHFVE
ncbi:MAG TPA: PepSY-like domain-containing protein [Chitinophagaceae bacterium]|nr:PepSY-like domain-containing protein [Chitinophagaceae bacterium]